MADIDQQLEDVRKNIQEAEAKETAAMAKGDISYAAALLAQITSLQNKENILIQLQQNQGEHICVFHNAILSLYSWLTDSPSCSLQP